MRGREGERGREREQERRHLFYNENKGEGNQYGVGYFIGYCMVLDITHDTHPSYLPSTVDQSFLIPWFSSIPNNHLNNYLVVVDVKRKLLTPFISIHFNQ